MTPVRAARIGASASVFVFVWVLLCACGLARAAPVTYNIDPNHTYPAFEADHMGGVSIWRGKFTRSSGKIVYDAAAKTGTVEVTIETASFNVGHEVLETAVRAENILDVARYPTATYKGKLTKFRGDAPTEVDGELTLHGVTKPVKLTITQFLCRENPRTHAHICGADATTRINRKDFGVGFGEEFGFWMDTKLLISIEAIRAE